MASLWVAFGGVQAQNLQPVPGCTGDLDGDGAINLNDLIVLLAHYGTTCPAPEPVVPAALWISEIHYNPSSIQGDDTVWEFIELYNPSPSPVNVSGWTLSNAVTCLLPDGANIAGHGFLVVCRNVDSLATQVPTGVPIFPWTPTSSLNNTGETIEIKRPDGSLADAVAYEDNDGWMTAPDGGGPSLEWMDVGLNNDEAASWAASFIFGGTPGRMNSMWGLGDPE
ncbi:MAG: hypothetical protein RJA19_889 [Bacteroidota bacterium]